MTGELINDFLKTDFNQERSDLRDILDKFREQTKIEKVKEEALVVNEIIKGTSFEEIIRLLNAKHSNLSFNQGDIRNFLERNRSIVKNLEKNKNILTRRHLTAITHIEEELGGLYLYTKQLLKKFEADGDNSATLGAVNALNKTLVNFAKLKGYGAFAPKDSHTNIEINIEERKNAKSLEANFKIVDITEEKEDGKISKEQTTDSG